MRCRAPWGKTQNGESHHLAHHCADVAACFAAIATLPAVRARMERAAGRALSATDITRLAVLAFLHDAGKLHPGFQAKGWPAGVWPYPKVGHVDAGAAIFAGAMKWELASNLHVEKIRTWGDEDGLVSLLHAVLAHHGRPFPLDNAAKHGWRGVPAAGYDPLAASQDMGKAICRWFAPAFAEGGGPLPAAPDFQHLLCGLVTLADWLGSTRAIFDYSPGLDPDYMEQARAKAQRAVVDIGLDVGELQQIIAGRTDFTTLSGRQDPPRPAQQRIGDFPLDEQLIILEAETGSGKTEAALWRFARLFEAGKVEGLYFALPTRAAAKQIHDRVNKAMQRVFGARAPEVVLAVPGYLKAGDIEGRALPGWEVRWDDDDRRDERQRLARWAAENAKRYLAAAVAVGTVDQVMLAGLQVKHAHLRAAALSRALLVIDEVHASDRYMSEVQAHLLKTHLGRGGHAMLMSATLGSVARTKWLTQRRRVREPAFDEAVATAYPAVWGSSQPEPLGVEGEGREKPVAMALAPSWDAPEAASRAIAAARSGARVLVIRNTVTAALKTFRAIRDAGQESLLWQVAGGPAVHHSRFASEDRGLLDTAVEAALSPDSTKRPQGGAVIIGTQTLEQSLDIDADVLITDLCPIDVLLQRIGRLHRHDLPRPAGFETPSCVVLAPRDGLDRLAAPAFDNGLGSFKDGGGVYRNLHACELTRRLVVEHPDWVIPAMNRLLVESATHPERIAALNGEKGRVWAEYWNGVSGGEMADAGAAANVALAVDKHFAETSLFPGDEEKIRTRLGAEGARVLFAGPLEGPFGIAVSGVTLPAHWSRGLVPEEKVAAAVEDGQLCFAIGDARFRYGREGLERMGK